MSKAKSPVPKKAGPGDAKRNRSTQQIARNAVTGGPKSVKKDKRAGAGRGQKG
jgi:hypothetical protein